MNQMFTDDVTRAEQLGVDAHEEDLGIVDVRCITYKRMTVVILETSDGLLVGGINAAWPEQRHEPDIGRAMARRKAHQALDRVRASRLENAKRNREAYCR